ncbi:MAG: SsrA-binding protein SmpB [Chitinispirillales bacterium]|jgi:SsrA-binding protein|nr:SsrA-binding protein SmpB [Chitinispirillales bacterium]
MKIIARNNKAFHDYEVIDKVEVGIMLTGAEVKSIRAGRVNLLDSYAFCSRGEMYINHLHISSYERGGAYTPEPYRRRKLLLHRKQIEYYCAEVERKQLTLVPLSIYFKEQWVKIELGLCKGRKKHDKRQKIAEQESKKRISQIMNLKRKS